MITGIEPSTWRHLNCQATSLMIWNILFRKRRYGILSKISLLIRPWVLMDLLGDFTRLVGQSSRRT